MSTWIQDDEPFPEAALADREGLVAFGGDLSVERLLDAYRHGLFPWSANPITWWSPDPRGIIELDGMHVSHSLARTLKRQKYQVTHDQAFAEVINACSKPRAPGEGVWITKEFINAYVRLHREGHAHSVECWLDGKLAGGIYGVAVGGLFAGESMFHRETDASEVALFYLVEHLRERGFELFDIQMVTHATEALGAKQIPRKEYLARLARAVAKPCRF